MKRKHIPAEAPFDLRRRLRTLAPRSHERRRVMEETAALYGVSEATLYRALQELTRPKALRPVDRGKPRVLSEEMMAANSELVVAIKIKTANKKGRHLSLVAGLGLDSHILSNGAPPSKLYQSSLIHASPAYLMSRCVPLFG